LSPLKIFWKFSNISQISVSHEIHEGLTSILITIKLDPEGIAKIYMPDIYDKIFEDLISEINDPNRRFNLSYLGKRVDGLHSFGLSPS